MIGDVSAPVVATLVGLVGGAPATWWLRRGAYRTAEDQLRLPLRWAWVTWPAAVFVSALLGAVHSGGSPLLFAAVLVYTIGAVIVTWIDLDVHRVPDKVLQAMVMVIGPLIVAATIAEQSWAVLGAAAAGCAALGVVYLLLAMFGTMGLGDVKLAAVTGTVLGAFGWDTLLTATLLAFVLATALALVLLVTRRASRSSHVAFGPAIAAGALLAIATN